MSDTDKNVLLSVKDLVVKFHVRGRILTAIRGISLDIYEDESIAIVGESGSGKSVFTKTFAGMLDSNGFIDSGEVIFNDKQLEDTVVPNNKSQVEKAYNKLNEYSKLELGADTYNKMQALKEEKEAKGLLTPEEEKDIEGRLHDLNYNRVEEVNLKQTFDPKTEKDKIKASADKIKAYEEKIEALQKEKAELIKKHKADLAADTAYLSDYNNKMASLKAQYAKKIAGSISEDTKKRNLIIAKEIYLSVGRYTFNKRVGATGRILKVLREAMRVGKDLSDVKVRNEEFSKVVLFVRYLDETEEKLHGTCVMDMARIKYADDWTQIRGTKIATVFQDPMTSLDPIITIGKQITSVIMKHQHLSEAEARKKAIEMMHKVGIPNAENRFDDYPFQYSGGMRQRIVIAIALSCQPKILICDEPTTALDVTIQAQVLKLIKDLQKELHYTIVFITHDLGVVANIADRVAVLYAGQIVEVGKVNEIFYDPKHPYTWALLSSLPQLAQKGTELYSITGTPPSLYNEIKGDAFAPRNPYCMKIDTLMSPPMFKVTETHYAKTWLLDPRSPKIEKPAAIDNITEKLEQAFNI